MKKILILFIVFILSLTIFGNFSYSNDIFGGSQTKIIYDNSDYGLKKGVEEAGGIRDIQTAGKASDYIQKIIAYILGFLALVSVILIIYAGFNILISAGDEEKVKKSKQIIMYTVFGLIIIFTAWSITKFIMNALI